MFPDTLSTEKRPYGMFMLFREDFDKGLLRNIETVGVGILSE